jgi:uncharacterized membrane protein
VAVRALSPGVNDPFTAMSCLDRLGSGIARLAVRELPSGFRYDDAGRLRVVARTFDFAHAVERAFDQVREAARDDAAVSARLFDALAAVLAASRQDEQRAAVLRQAAFAAGAARRHLEEPGREAISQRLAALSAAARRAERGGAPDEGAATASAI